MDLGQAANVTGDLRVALHEAGLPDALVTGPPALQHDLTPVLTSDLQRGELLAGVLALVVLLAALGLCWAVLIPFLVAGATVAGTLGVVYLLAQHFLMVLYVPNVIELIGLALAIDYSLLMVHRFRTEVRHEDVSVEDAILATMRSAGRTVVLSGVAVAIGLATLLIVPVPFVRSLGAAGLVVPLFSLAAALSPAARVAVVLRTRRRSTTRPARSDVADATSRPDVWSRIARGVVRRPLLVLLVDTDRRSGACRRRSSGCS